MTGQYCGGQEKEWEMTSVYKLYRLEQNLSKRLLPPALNRPIGRCNGRPSSNEFLRCLLGVPLALDNQEMMTFVTPTGNYHYKVMPFDLKNSGSTYQRMMTRMFEPQLGKNIEVYINDMVVKSKVVSEHVGDLRRIFEILRKHKLRLNASKCSFRVGSGKLLGYMVTHRGIEINPDQIKAINGLQPPRIPRKYRS